MDGVGRPLGPVDEVAVDGDGEGMDRGGEKLAEVAVEVGGLDLVEVGVGPEEAAGAEVDGEAVGPLDVGGYDGFVVGADQA